VKEHAIAADTRTLGSQRPATDRAATVVTRRRLARALASLTALAAGVLYALMAAGTIQVTDPAAQTEAAPAFIPIAAAAAFVLGAILIDRFDRRIVQILGAGVQVITLIGYFAVASGRTPSYEVWGIVIKILQVVTLAALAYLAVRAPWRTTGK
jgi:hypothetical protein